jgi:hypothetical protein
MAFVGNFYIDLTKLLHEPVLLLQSQIQRLSRVVTGGSASWGNSEEGACGISDGLQRERAAGEIKCLCLTGTKQQEHSRRKEQTKQNLKELNNSAIMKFHKH